MVESRQILLDGILYLNQAGVGVGGMAFACGAHHHPDK